MKHISKSLFFLSLFFQFAASAQNQAMNWYFGNNAGLNFATNPPTVLTNGALVTAEGCATISDPSGNLLFYTDGSTVWNSSHLTMANGTGLFGNSSSTQGALIVKQPGSPNLYHIFTLDASGSNSLCVSTVDMLLASGSGSVITKNVLLSTNMTEKMTGAKHCNGSDYWVITHENNTNNFKTFLVTSAGVSLTPVVSATGPSNIGGLGTMKSSPNGRMIASSRNMPGQVTDPTGDVFSFDQNSGQVNFLYTLYTGAASYGCEFSPDGTKLYFSGYFPSYYLSQFDMCAGSPTAVAASMYTMACTSLLGAMQVGPDGKIYCARSTSTLGVINSPDLSGALCNFLEDGISIAPKTAQLGLPNFAIAFTPTLQPFTFTLAGCSNATFSAPPIAQSTISGCSATSNSFTGVEWNFGDPMSGSANTSTLTNPQHNFMSPGSHTVTFVLHSACWQGNDTLTQVVTLNGIPPSMVVSGNFTMCTGDKRVYTATGAHSYSWTSGATTNTAALNPSSTTGYTVTGTNTVTGCSGSTTFTINVKPCTSISELTNVEAHLNIYPNPSDKLLYLENTVKTQFVLINQRGELITQQEFAPGLNSLDMSIYEDGIYTLRAISSQGTTVRRVVKVSR